MCVCLWACVALGGRQIVEANKPGAIRIFKQEDKSAVGELEKGPFLAGHIPQVPGLARVRDAALSLLGDPTSGVLLSAMTARGSLGTTLQPAQSLLRAPGVHPGHCPSSIGPQAREFK